MILCVHGNHWTKTVLSCQNSICGNATCKDHGQSIGRKFFCNNCIRVFGDELKPGRPYSNMPPGNQSWERDNLFREYVDDL
jgi:hypothetical protein